MPILSMFTKYRICMVNILLPIEFSNVIGRILKHLNAVEDFQLSLSDIKLNLQANILLDSLKNVAHTVTHIQKWDFAQHTQYCMQYIWIWNYNLIKKKLENVELREKCRFLSAIECLYNLCTVQGILKILQVIMFITCS